MCNCSSGQIMRIDFRWSIAREKSMFTRPSNRPHRELWTGLESFEGPVINLNGSIDIGDISTPST